MRIGVITFFIIVIAVKASDYDSLKSPFSELIEGFLRTMNKNRDFNNVILCLNDAEEIFTELIEAWRLFTKFNYDDMMKAVKLFGKAMIDLIMHMEDCRKAYDEFKKIANAIRNFDVFNVITKIMKDIVTFRSYVSELVIAIRIEDYLEIGRVLGQATYKILFEFANDLVQLDINIHFLFDFAEGFLEGFGNGILLKDTEACVAGMPGTFDELAMVIQLLKEINFKDYTTFIKVAQQLLKVLYKIYDTIKFCLKAPFELKDIIIKIININGTKLYERVIRYQLEIMNDIGQLFKYIAELKLKDAGKSLGNIPYLLLIKDD